MRRISWQALSWSALTSLGLISGCTAGPFPFSTEWYAERACDPPGTRQVEKYGKQWPPYSRPVGRKQTMMHGYHTAHYWPYPYSEEDRATVNDLFDQQTAAGWLENSTLHEFHFQQGTNQLSEAGQNHVRWLATCASPQFRCIYVAQGSTPEIGQSRVEEVERYMRDSMIENPPPVSMRNDFHTGRPANEVAAQRKAELNSIPSQRLFMVGMGGGGGAGGATSSQGGQGGGSGGGATKK